MCGQCLDEKFIKTKKNTVHTDCPVNTRKRFYRCLGKDCKKHFWLCNSHSTLNAHKFKSSEKFWSERGKIFANVSIFKVSKTSGSKVKNSKSNTDNVVDNEKCSLKEATEKLKASAKGAKIVEVPEGEPLLLLSYAVGKTRPVNVFYDKGCSHVVFKHGVPKYEIEREMTRAGPFTINGFGDTPVTVRDEWACLLDRMDGSKQVLNGVSVDKITAYCFCQGGEG